MVLREKFGSNFLFRLLYTKIQRNSKVLLVSTSYPRIIQNIKHVTKCNRNMYRESRKLCEHVSLVLLSLVKMSTIQYFK